jgi:hypothetical protein
MESLVVMELAIRQIPKKSATAFENQPPTLGDENLGEADSWLRPREGSARDEVMHDDLSNDSSDEWESDASSGEESDDDFGIAEALGHSNIDVKLMGAELMRETAGTHEERLAAYWTRVVGRGTPVQAGRTDSGMQSFSLVLRTLMNARKGVRIVADGSFSYFELHTLLPDMDQQTDAQLGDATKSAVIANPAPNLAGTPKPTQQRWSYQQLLEAVDAGLTDVILDITDVAKDDPHLIEFVRNVRARGDKHRITMVASGAKHRQNGHDKYNFGEVVVIGAAIDKLGSLFTTDPLQDALLDLVWVGNTRTTMKRGGDRGMMTAHAATSTTPTAHASNSSRSSTSAPVLPDRTLQLPGRTTVRITRTPLDGNCLLHAMFGVPSNGQCVHPDPASLRRTLAGLVRGQPDTHVELLRDLVSAALRGAHNRNEKIFAEELASRPLWKVLQQYERLSEHEVACGQELRFKAIEAIVNAEENADLTEAIMMSLADDGANLDGNQRFHIADENLGCFQAAIPYAYGRYLEAINANVHTVETMVDDHKVALADVYAACVLSGPAFFLYESDAYVLSTHAPLPVRVLSPYASWDESVVHGDPGQAVNVLHRGAHYERADRV